MFKLYTQLLPHGLAWVTPQQISLNFKGHVPSAFGHFSFIDELTHQVAEQLLNGMVFKHFEGEKAFNRLNFSRKSCDSEWINTVTDSPSALGAPSGSEGCLSFLRTEFENSWYPS